MRFIFLLLLCSLMVPSTQAQSQVSLLSAIRSVRSNNGTYKEYLWVTFDNALAMLAHGGTCAAFKDGDIFFRYDFSLTDDGKHVQMRGPEGLTDACKVLTQNDSKDPKHRNAVGCQYPSGNFVWVDLVNNRQFRTIDEYELGFDGTSLFISATGFEVKGDTKYPMSCAAWTQPKQ